MCIQLPMFLIIQLTIGDFTHTGGGQLRSLELAFTGIIIGTDMVIITVDAMVIRMSTSILIIANTIIITIKIKEILQIK